MSDHSLLISFENYTLSLPLLGERKGDTTLSNLTPGPITATVPEYYDPASFFDPYGGPDPGINFIRIPNCWPVDVAAGNPSQLGESYPSGATNAGLDSFILAKDGDPSPRWYVPYDKQYRFYFKTFRLDNYWWDGVTKFPVVGRAVPMGYGRYDFEGGAADYSQQLASDYPYQLTDSGGRVTYCVLVGVVIGYHFHLQDYVRDRGDGNPNYSSYDPFGGSPSYFYPIDPAAESGWWWQSIFPGTYTETISGVTYTRYKQNCGFYPYYREYVDFDRVNDSPPDKFNQYYDSTWEVDYTTWNPAMGTLSVSDGTIRERAIPQYGKVNVYEMDGITRIPSNVSFGAYSGTDNSAIACIPKGSLLDNVRDSTGALTHLHLRSTAAYLPASLPDGRVQFRPPRYQLSPFATATDDPLDLDPHFPHAVEIWAVDDAAPPEQIFASYTSKTATDLNGTLKLYEDATTSTETAYFFSYNEFFGGELVSQFYDVVAVEIASPHRRFVGKLWIHEDDTEECTLVLAPSPSGGGLSYDIDRLQTHWRARVNDDGYVVVGRRGPQEAAWTEFPVDFGSEPSIKVDETDPLMRVHVLYHDLSDNTSLATNDANGNGGWSIVSLYTGEIHPQQVILKGQGIHVHTTWADVDGGTIYARRRDLNGVIGSAVAIAAGVPEQAAPVDVDADGHLFCLYDDGTDVIRKESTDSGLTWAVA